VKYTAVFIVFVLLVIGVLYFLSGGEYSKIPLDADHAGITDTAVCMQCHGPQGKNAMKDSHPPKYECFKCHRAGG